MHVQHNDNHWIQLSSDYIPLPMSSSSSSGSSHHAKGYLEENARGYGLVHVIAFILNKIVDQRSNDPILPAMLTNFHATRPPSIRLIDYLLRILKYASSSSECFVLALIYIDRLEQAIVAQKNYPIVSQLSVHRIVLISVVLAAKFFDDQYYNNAFYAKVGGISCQEINTLEKDFCAAIDYRFHVTTDDYSRYYNELAKHAEFLKPYKEKSALYMREMKVCYPEDIYNDGNNFFGKRFAYDYTNKILKSVAYSVAIDKQNGEEILSYMATFSYDNNLRVKYVESLNASTLHCSRYLLCPPTRGCAMSVSPTAHCLPSPYVSPVVNRIIPSPFCVPINTISNARSDKLGKPLYRNDVNVTSSTGWNNYPSIQEQQRLSIDEEPSCTSYFAHNGYNDYFTGGSHQRCPLYYPPVSMTTNEILPYSCHGYVLKPTASSNMYDMMQPANAGKIAASERHFEAYAKNIREVQPTL